MSLFREVKCSRCDRPFSGLLSKCPYCGHPRSVPGKRAEEDDSKKWKILVAVLLITIMLVAVIVLIAGAARDKRDADAVASASAALEAQVNSVSASPTYTPPPSTPTPSPTPVVIPIESLQLRYGGEELEPLVDSDYDYDISMIVGETLPLECYIVPETAKETAKIVWASSDDKILTVLQTGELTGIGDGAAYLTVTVNDTVTVKAIIRVNGN